MANGQATQTDSELLRASWAARPPASRKWAVRFNLGLPRLPLTFIVPIIILTVCIICSVTPGWISSYGPTELDAEAILAAPSQAHWLGTDQFGRDILTLLVYGAQQSLMIGSFTVAIGLCAGGLIGLVAGYAGGVLDMALMRLIDLWMSVPYLLLVIVIATALGPSFSHIIFAIGMVMIPRFARVMRSQVVTINCRPFVEASHSIGSSNLSILFRHIMPHTLGPMLVMVTLGVAEGVLVGASLSFIGLGVIDDRPDWGFLLSQGRNYVSVAWWFAAFPGLAITALVISINMLGDELRARLDPHLASPR